MPHARASHWQTKDLVRELEPRKGVDLQVRRPGRPVKEAAATAATAIQKGIPLPALQRLLGPNTLLTTEIYLNLSPEHVVEAFQQKWLPLGHEILIFAHFIAGLFCAAGAVLTRL